MRVVHVKYCGRFKYQGRQDGADQIAWYDKPFESLLSDYFNTGDICVYESTLRLLATREKDFFVNVDAPVDTGQVEQIKGNADFILLRGSNYIHEGMNWNFFAEWLEALDLPVLVVGVGAQAEVERPIILPPEGLRVWKAISDRCKSIGVRGSFSADTLHRNGIHNIELVGCPSVFRGRDRNMQLRHAANGPRRISFSVRREVDRNYAEDPRQFVDTQKRLIAKLDQIADLWLSSHGEPEEKAFCFKSPEHMRRASEKLVAEGWFDENTGPALRRLYESRLYYVGAPGDYDVYARQFDAAIGYRVHAVLPAVAMGVPGSLFSYDTRSRELAESFDLPIYRPEEFERLPLHEALDASRFNTFQTRFQERYDHMKAFIEANGAKTRM